MKVINIFWIEYIPGLYNEEEIIIFATVCQFYLKLKGEKEVYKNWTFNNSKGE